MRKQDREKIDYGDDGIYPWILPPLTQVQRISHHQVSYPPEPPNPVIVETMRNCWPQRTAARSLTWVHLWVPHAGPWNAFRIRKIPARARCG